MKATTCTRVLLGRLLLPLSLLAAAVLRSNIISLAYFILVVISPLVPGPKNEFKGAFKVFTLVVVVYSGLLCLAHGTFQLFLVISAKHNDKPYGEVLGNCSSLEILLQEFGFTRVDAPPNLVGHSVRLLLPDAIVFLMALLTFCVLRKVYSMYQNSETSTRRNSLVGSRLSWLGEYIQKFGEFTMILFIGVCGAMLPSVTSAVYLLLFFGIILYWSTIQTMRTNDFFKTPAYKVFKKLLMTYVIVHMILLYCCQLYILETWLESSSGQYFGRLFGMTSLMESNCIEPWNVHLAHVSWPAYVNPLVLFCTYLIMALQIAYERQDNFALPVSMNPFGGTENRGSERQPAGDVRQPNLHDELLRNEQVPHYDSTDNSPTQPSSVNSPDVPLPVPERAVWKSMLRFLMKISYVISLVAMLAWSVIYPSWTAIVFLILSCMLWLFPHTRRVVLCASPLYVAYAVGLTCLQYVCSINFGGLDYNTTLFFNNPNKDIGLEEYDYPCTAIMVKIFLTVCFCMTLRQYMQERKRVRARANDTVGLCLTSLTQEDDVPSNIFTSTGSLADNKHLKLIGSWFYGFLSKFWIVLFSIVFLIMAVQESYIYRIIYLVLFLFYAITFHLSDVYWRKILKPFLFLIVLYSIVAILFIYVLSFHDVLLSFQNVTGLSSNILADLGFDPDINYQDETANLDLLLRLLVPAVLLVTVMLQIHLFHEKFMILTDPKALRRDSSSALNNSTTSDLSTYAGWTGAVVKWYNSTSRFRSDMINALCAFVDVHWFKAVMLIAAYITCYTESTALDLVLFFCVVVNLFSTRPTVWRKACLLVTQFFVGIIVLAKMLFQLRTVPKTYFKNNCTGETSYLNGTVDGAKWFGLKDLGPDESLSYYIGGYIGLIVAYSFLALMQIRQYYHHKSLGDCCLQPSTVFHNVNRDNWDHGLCSLIKYLINYGFFKFGLEISFITSAVVISCRQDVIGVLYAILLFLLVLLKLYRRSLVRHVWGVYYVFLSLLLPLQYASALGLPPPLCYDYPWDTNPNLLHPDGLRLWLYLPTYERLTAPNVKLLFVDFLQLLVVSLQWQVFCDEGDNNNPIVQSAGDNEELPRKPPASFAQLHDFIDKKRNFADVGKSFVFLYSFWVTISILFITATQNINFYCLGYLISCFYFFWQGLDFLTKNKATVLRLWNLVLMYNVGVILIKCSLQVLGCVYLKELLVNEAQTATAESSVLCVAAEIFSIKCLSGEKDDTDKEVCSVSAKEAGLVWDIVCFTFLLIQKRVFMSRYFFVVVVEETSQDKLSSFGGKVIYQLLIKRIREQKKQEKNDLEKIRAKIEKIRQRTQRLTQESRDDWTHYEVIRSGESHMFPEDSDEETSIWSDELDPAKEKAAASPFGMIVTAVNQGMKASIAESKRQNSIAETSRWQEKRLAQTAEAESESEAGDEDKEFEEAGFANPPMPKKMKKPLPVAVDETDESKGEDEQSSADDVLKTAPLWYKTFFINAIKFIINFLLDFSRDYRLVARKLNKLQVEVKEQTKNEMIYGESRIEESGDESGASTEHVHVLVVDEDLDGADESEEEIGRSLLYRLGNAIYHAIIARTELLCYFSMILCQMCNGNLLSLPLPIMAIVWGMLSVPRPAKTFWITVLSYVMVVVLLKYIFQFGFYPWNGYTQWQQVIGLGRYQRLCKEGDTNCQNDGTESTYYAAFELFVMLCILVHRSVLKRYGLWKNAGDMDIEIEKMIEDSKKEIGDTSDELLEVGNDGSGDHAAERGPTDTEQQELIGDEEEQSKVQRRTPLLTGPVGRWYKYIMSGHLSAKRDYYAIMFFCDFLNFLISVFAYSAFGPPQYGDKVQDYIQQNRIPVPFLLLLLVQFVLIVIDRALYLKKSVKWRLVYHLFLVVVVHVWLFYILPAITDTPFIDNHAAQLWYFIKCFYFVCSAQQIKAGYPTRVLGNFLTSKYTYVNLALFKGYLIIPFLHELRCVMDWMWTDTSMDIFTWFDMEDIFSKIYSLKCNRDRERDHPTPRGQNRRALVKYGLGGLIVILLILIIWFPLLLFSFVNEVYNTNPPIDCKAEVSIGGFQNIFTVHAQQSGISRVTETMLRDFRTDQRRNPRALGFLDSYDTSDIYTVYLAGSSTTVWGISPPSEELLKSALASNDTLLVSLSLSFSRSPKDGLKAETISSRYDFKLPADSRVRRQLRTMVVNRNGDEVLLPLLIPRYLRLPVADAPAPVSSLLCDANTECTALQSSRSETPYHGLTLKMEHADTNTSSEEWWVVGERSRFTQTLPPKPVTEKTFSQLYFVTFSDRVAPSNFAFITSSGILGLYVSLVFVIGRFIRGFTSDGAYTIMFQELPNVDRILHICKDLYFARENRELKLEEDLYAKLVFLYRCPEQMIKWTAKEKKNS